MGPRGQRGGAAHEVGDSPEDAEDRKRPKIVDATDEVGPYQLTDHALCALREALEPASFSLRELDPEQDLVVVVRMRNRDEVPHLERSQEHQAPKQRARPIVEVHHQNALGASGVGLELPRCGVHVDRSCEDQKSRLIPSQLHVVHEDLEVGALDALGVRDRGLVLLPDDLLDGLSGVVRSNPLGLGKFSP